MITTTDTTEKKSFRLIRQDIVNQKYLSGQTNFLLCTDGTVICEPYCMFCVIDIASRNRVGHCFLNKPINVSHVIETLTRVLDDRKFWPQVPLIHSDRESLFKNVPYEQLLEDYKTIISIASSARHGNPVIERTFRTLKDFMRKRLNLPKKSTISLKPFKTFEEKAQFVKQIIEFYNNKSHSALKGMCPNFMEEGLLFKYNNTTPTQQEEGPSLVQNDNSDVTSFVRQYKDEAIQVYVNLYKKNFSKDEFKQSMIHFANYSMQGFQQILQKQEQHSKEIYQQNIDIKKILDFLEEETRINQNKTLLKEERAFKRKNGITQKLRDSINEIEFQGIIDLIKHNHFVASRKKTKKNGTSGVFRSL